MNLDNIKNDTKEKIEDNVKDDTKEKIEDNVKDDTKEKIEDNVKDDTKEKIEDNVKDDTKEKIEDNVKDDTKEKIEDNAKDDIKEKIEDNIKDDIKEKIKDNINMDKKKMIIVACIILIFVVGIFSFGKNKVTDKDILNRNLAMIERTEEFVDYIDSELHDMFKDGGGNFLDKSSEFFAEFLDGSFGTGVRVEDATLRIEEFRIYIDLNRPKLYADLELKEKIEISDEIAKGAIKRAIYIYDKIDDKFLKIDESYEEFKEDIEELESIQK